MINRDRSMAFGQFCPPIVQRLILTRIDQIKADPIKCKIVRMSKACVAPLLPCATAPDAANQRSFIACIPIEIRFTPPSAIAAEPARLDRAGIGFKRDFRSHSTLVHA